MTESLLDGLRAGATGQATGVFTLDAARAREKLREFQLADPHRYILLLVQAMAARGASRIDIRIDADDMEMRSDATPFSHDELGSLYILLFSDAPPPAGLRELALALNAAMATDPRWVRVACSDGSVGAWLEQHNDGPDRLERVKDGRLGIGVHLKARFGLGIVRRFLRLGDEPGRGRALLQVHCGFSRIPIVLDDTPIERRRPDAAIARWEPVMFDGVDLGEIGLTPSGGAGHLELVRHQVWIARHVFDDPTWVGLRGTVDVSTLRTDASLADVVRDGRYEQVIAAVEIARDRALATWITAEAAAGRAPLGPLVDVVCRRIAALRPHAQAGVDARPLSAFLGAALWSTITGVRRTTADLLATPAVRCSGLDLRSAPAALADVILVDDTTRAALALVVGPQLEDVTALVHRVSAREKNREALAARHHTSALPSYYHYVEQHREQNANAACEVGWAPNNGPSWLRLICEDRLLVELPLAAAPSTTNAVVTAAFTMNDVFDDVVRDAVFVAAVHTLLVAIDRQAGAICARMTNERIPTFIREELLHYYVEAAEGEHLPAVLASYGIGDEATVAAVRAMGEPWAQRGDVAAHPLWLLPMFASASGHAVTVQQVAAAIEEDGFVRVVTTQERLLDDAPELAVRVDDPRRRLIEALFGADAIRDADAEFRRWQAAQRWALDGRRRPLALGVPCVLGPLPFEHPAGAGVVGIVRAIGLVAPLTRVDVLVASKSLTTVELAPSLRGLVVALEIEPRWANEGKDGLGAGGMAVIEFAVEVAVETTLDAVVARAAATEVDEFEILVDMVALALPSPTFVRLWIVLGDRRSAKARAAAYAAILALADPRDCSSMDGALRAALGRGEIPSAESLRAEVGQGREPTARSGAGHRHAAVLRLARLLEVQILSTLAGRGLGLGDVFDAIVHQGSFEHVRSLDCGLPPGFGDVTLLGAEQRAALERLLGPSALRDRTHELTPAPLRTEVREDTPPVPEPASERTAAAPTVTVLLHGRLLAELRALLRGGVAGLTEAHLGHVVVDMHDGTRIVAREDARIVVDARHPIVRRALVGEHDPLLVSVVASAVLTALNLAFVDVCDAAELGLLRLHAEHMRAAARG